MTERSDEDRSSVEQDRFQLQFRSFACCHEPTKAAVLDVCVSRARSHLRYASLLGKWCKLWAKEIQPRTTSARQHDHDQHTLATNCDETLFVSALLAKRFTSRDNQQHTNWCTTEARRRQREGRGLGFDIWTSQARASVSERITTCFLQHQR
jgi:hypothetical protein